MGQHPARYVGVKRCHPQRREGHSQAQHHQDPPGHTVPVGPAAPQPSGELEGAEDGVQHGADDVHDHGYWRSGNARVDGQQVGTAGQLDQPQSAGYGGNHNDGDQWVRHPPDRATRPGGAYCGVDGHLAPTASSCELTGLRMGVAACVRWSRHRE